MKTIARTGAVMSFAFFFFPGACVLAQLDPSSRDEILAIVIGCSLIGLAFFVGTLLWMAGEKWGSAPPGS